MVTAQHSRDSRLDALKGFAILCVVTYHATGQYYSFTPAIGVVYYTWAVYLRAFLFSFMLPLFAFLSGFVLGRPGGFRPRGYFLKRTLGLLVPYICWETLYGPSKHPEILKSVAAFLAYYPKIFLDPHYEGRMWYLYALWMALMALGIVRLLGDRTWAILASVPVVWILGSYGQFGWIRWLYFFVVLGVLTRRFELWLQPRVRLLGVIGAVAFAPLWLVAEPEPYAADRLAGLISDPTLLAAGQFALGYVPLLVGTAAVAALFWASFHLHGIVETNLAFLGRLSLGIYITHFPFVEMWNHMPAWFLPVNVALATTIAVGWTLALGMFRPTAALLLGEPWTARRRPLGDVRTETL